MIDTRKPTISKMLSTHKHAKRDSYTCVTTLMTHTTPPIPSPCEPRPSCRSYCGLALQHPAKHPDCGISSAYGAATLTRPQNSSVNNMPFVSGVKYLCLLPTVPGSCMHCTCAFVEKESLHFVHADQGEGALQRRWNSCCADKACAGFRVASLEKLCARSRHVHR
jgi:hypothetical protein